MHTGSLGTDRGQGRVWTKGSGKWTLSQFDALNHDRSYAMCALPRGLVLSQATVVMYQLLRHRSTLSRCRQVFILLLLDVSKPSLRRIHFRAAGAVCGLLWPTRQTEATRSSRGTFCEAGCARSCFSARAAADDWDLVRDGSEDVEDEIVDKQCCPWADGDDTEEQLEKSALSHVLLAHTSGNCRVTVQPQVHLIWDQRQAGPFLEP